MTPLVRFAAPLDFFIFFASGNGRDGIISSFRFVIKINVKLKFTGIMEVVVIEKATFERMLSGFEFFAEKVERLCREHERKKISRACRFPVSAAGYFHCQS